MNTDELFRIVGRLFLESQAAIERLQEENARLKKELEEIGLENVPPRPKEAKAS